MFNFNCSFSVLQASHVIGCADGADKKRRYRAEGIKEAQLVAEAFG